jgi:hypothetical protein
MRCHMGDGVAAHDKYGLLQHDGPVYAIARTKSWGRAATQRIGKAD